MAKNVYILGAGFSRGFDQEAYPLLSDFLVIAEKLGSYEPTKKHHALAKFIERYFGSYKYDNIEKIITFLSAPSLDDKIIRLENRSFLYEQIINIVVSTLGKAPRQAVNNEIQSIYENFVDHLAKSNSIVVSFNYDLLLERLLYEKGYWCGYDGYGVGIEREHNANPFPPSRKLALYRLDKSKKSKVLILKPHGSINWGTLTLDTQDDPPLYQSSRGFYHKSDTPYAMPSVSSINDVIERPWALDLPYTSYFKPLILPPALDKSEWYRHKVIRSIWNMTKETIRDYGDITVIGYSLPETDYLTEFLFRQAVAYDGSSAMTGYENIGDEKVVKKITIVDPNVGNLKLRFDSVFGFSVNVQSCYFTDWWKLESNRFGLSE